jgi:flagellar protein FlgJ
MNIAPLNAARTPTPPADQAALRQTFESTFGQTLFGQVFKSMRKTVGKPAYFHGGRGEEIFQRQLDQVLAEKMSRSSASRFVGPMYDLFALQRK